MERGVSSPRTASPLTSSVEFLEHARRATRSSSARCAQRHQLATLRVRWNSRRSWSSARCTRRACPAIAAIAMASSLLVVLPMAETTTTGFARQPGLDDAGDALDGGRRLDRRAAELHDDH